MGCNGGRELVFIDVENLSRGPAEPYRYASYANHRRVIIARRRNGWLFAPERRNVGIEALPFGI